MNEKALNFSRTGGDLPINFFFVLLDSFTLLSLAAAIDSLRLANQLSKKTLFSWTIVGEELAFAVSDQLLYTEIRDTKLTNRLSMSTRIGTHIPKLNHAIELMESHIEDPLNLTDVANAVGLSQRQLERLFLNNLERTPKKFYVELRLQKARNLLLQTDLKIIDVAVICGFVSAGHFSKVYKHHYKISPSFERSAIQK